MTSTPVLYEIHDLKIQPASVKGLSWMKAPGRKPVLVTDDRLVEEMAAFGATRPSELGDALHLFVENMLANPRGTKAPTPGLVFHEWIKCYGLEPVHYSEEAPEQYIVCGRADLKHTKVNDDWGHLVPDEPGAHRVNPLHNVDNARDPHGFQAYVDTLPPEQKPSALLLDAHEGQEAHTPIYDAAREAIENPLVDSDVRVALRDAGEVKNLADGVTRVAGFEEALRDITIGHKAIGEMFSFTSETSVRRWRKSQGVVLS